MNVELYASRRRPTFWGGAVFALLLVGASSPAFAQSDLDTLRHAREQLGKALQDPEKVKIMECRGVKVYQDPQPAGHPPSPAECQEIIQNIENRNQPPSRENAESFYHSRYLLAGFLLRAGYVCDADSKRMIDASFALIETNEFKTMSQSYPDTTRRWMEEGAQNFNSQTMKNSVREACRFASETRQKAEAIAKAN